MWAGPLAVSLLLRALSGLLSAAVESSSSVFSTIMLPSAATFAACAARRRSDCTRTSLGCSKLHSS